MKFLKYFESEEQFREVDLTELWFDYCEYFDKAKISKFIDELNILLVGKKIEFHRAKNPIDGEITYAFEDIVKDIQYQILSSNGVRITTVLENHKNHQFILAILYFNKEVSVENIIRIYNSQKTEFEKRLDFLKDTDKYNL